MQLFFIVFIVIEQENCNNLSKDSQLADRFHLTSNVKANILVKRMARKGLQQAFIDTDVANDPYSSVTNTAI
jgi:hypothetical protein